MTWKEFKDAVEAAGVRDHFLIEAIDVEKDSRSDELIVTKSICDFTARDYVTCGD